MKYLGKEIKILKVSDKYCTKCGQLLSKKYINFRFFIEDGSVCYDIIWECTERNLRNFFIGHTKIKTEDGGYPLMTGFFEKGIVTRRNWDWFNFQAEDTDKDRKLKTLVVNMGGALFIFIMCLILFFTIGLICGGN